MSDSDLCEWHGVTRECGADNSSILITQLELDDLNLQVPTMGVRSYTFHGEIGLTLH